MTHIFKSLFFAAVVTLGCGAALRAEPIVAYTAVLPPYTLGADAARPGISHDLLVEMASRAGVALEITYLPWGRAQETVQKTPNSLLFTATRSAAREDKYGWVALMVQPQEVFVTVGPRIDSYEAASSLSQVLVLANTPRSRRLQDAGMSDLTEVTEVEQAARMLNGGRVEAWYTLNQRAAAAFVEVGLDPSQLVFGEALKTSDNWLASNLEFDPAIAAALAKALEEMRADGTYDAVLERYLG